MRLCINQSLGVALCCLVGPCVVFRTVLVLPYTSEHRHCNVCCPEYLLFVSRSDVCVGLFCNTADRFARLSVWLAGAYCLVVFTVSVGLSRASQDGLHKQDVRGVRVGLLVWPCRFKVVCVCGGCVRSLAVAVGVVIFILAGRVLICLGGPLRTHLTCVHYLSVCPFP